MFVSPVSIREVPPWYAFDFIYTMTSAAFDLFGVQSTVDPDAMDIVTHRDFFPVRRWVPWSEHPDLNEFLARVEQSYEWAKEKEIKTISVQSW